MTLDDLLAHKLRMRSVNKAVGYETAREDAEIAAIRGRVRREGGSAPAFDAAGTTREDEGP
jgi:hypothetical protein